MTSVYRNSMAVGLAVASIQFISIQFYCRIGMTERSQWTEYKMNNQLYKQRTAEHNRLRQTVMTKHSPSMYMHTQRFLEYSIVLIKMLIDAN